MSCAGYLLSMGLLKPFRKKKRLILRTNTLQRSLAGRVSRSLHKCRLDAAELEKMQSNLRAYSTVGAVHESFNAILSAVYRPSNYVAAQHDSEYDAVLLDIISLLRRIGRSHNGCHSLEVGRLMSS